MTSSASARPVKYVNLLFCFVLVGALYGPYAAHAQEEQPSDATGATDAGVAAEPAELSLSEFEKAVEQVEEKTEGPIPTRFTIEFDDTHDWIRLTSGEWLKGDLNWMREKEFEFDSDKLDIVTKSWSKVDELHSPQINTYAFEGKIDVMGKAVVTKDSVIIETTEGVKTFPRSELLSIAEGGRRERDWWSTRLSLGFSANAGNTNQGSLTIAWGLQRADQRTLATMSYQGTFGYVNKEQNVNRHLGGVGVKLLIWRRFYVTPAVAYFLYDRFQNLKLRATPGAGGGIHIVDKKKVEWDFGSGLGYQYTQFLSAATGVENPQNDGFVTLHTYADFDFTDDIELKLDWRTNLVYTAIGNTNHVGNAAFKIDLTAIFYFQTSFLFLRTENPPPRADGTMPEQNDYQLVVSIALEIG